MTSHSWGILIGGGGLIILFVLSRIWMERMTSKMYRDWKVETEAFRDECRHRGH